MFLLLNHLHKNTVMGIKGRRVHMIEELSQTIISFQRGKQIICRRLDSIMFMHYKNNKFYIYIFFLCLLHILIFLFRPKLILRINQDWNPVSVIILFVYKIVKAGMNGNVLLDCIKNTLFPNLFTHTRNRLENSLIANYERPF